MGDQAAVGTEHADGISDEQQADDLRCHHPRRVARPSSLLIVISPGNKVLVPHGVVSALVIFVHLQWPQMQQTVKISKAGGSECTIQTKGKRAA